MGQLKIAEYTFDNSVGDCLPTITPNVTKTTEDVVDGNITTRKVFVDDTTKITGMSFTGNMALLTVEYVHITSDMTSTYTMFYGCQNMTSIDLSYADTSNVTTMYRMFCKCPKLTSLDVSSFDTSKVTNMYQFVYLNSGMTSLTFGDKFDTSKVTDMGYMFGNCSGLTSLDVSMFDTSKVTNMSYLFSYCTGLQSLDLSSFSTKSVTTFANMMAGCNSLQSLDVSNFHITPSMNTGSLITNANQLTSVGMLFCDANTINTLTGFINKGLAKTIWYHDAKEDELTPQNTITFEKYSFPTKVQLPPHIHLHSLPDGTKDEVDLETGILTRNVGCLVLDGENTQGIWTHGIAYDNTFRMSFIFNDNYSNKPKSFAPTITPNNIIVSIEIYDGEHICVDGDGNIRLFLSKNKASTKTEYVQYLHDNPITLYYVLETPTTEQLILNYNNSCDYGRILPTGICDKYDVVNSMYTQTMASIPLNGVNIWNDIADLGTVLKFTATGTTVGVDNLNMKGAGGLYCDNDLFPNINDDSDVEHCRVDEEGNKFYIYISKDRLMSPDLIGWQIWLQTNPFNMWYELEEHLIYTKPYEELDPTQARWDTMDCFRDGSIKYNTHTEDGLTIYPTLEYVAPSINNFEVPMLEPNTEYTMYAEGIGEGDTINLGGNDINFNNGTVYTSGENQWLRIDNNDSFYNMVITKGDTTGEVVPYFEGMTSVKMPVLTTTGKNLYNKNTSFSGWVNSKGDIIKYGAVGVGNNILSDYIKISPTKRYTMNAAHYQWYYDVNKKYIDQPQTVSANITPPNNASYIVVGKSISSLDEKLFSILDSIQLEENSTATSYEPFKSNILTVNEEVTLRGIGDVKDELNLITGELTQRVGEIVLDETLGWKKGGWCNEHRQELYLDTSKSSFNIASGVDGDTFLCDTFKSVEYTFGSSNPEGMGVGINAGGNISVYIHKDKLTANSFEGALQYLKENQIRLVYTRKTPIIKTIDLKCVNQAGETIDNLCAFDEGAIRLSSDTGLLPTVHYSVPSTNVFNLPSIKTGTRYTLKYPSASGSISIGDMTYKVTSPSMLFTTPLTMSGDASAVVFTDTNPQDVMLIEGDYSKREMSFFERLRSSENIAITTTYGDSTNTVETGLTLRSLPNGLSDKFNFATGKLVRVADIRDYQEGDNTNKDVYTDGYKTVYPLTNSIETTVEVAKPVGYSDGVIELKSDALIPTFRYRLPSSNNFVLDLLKPSTKYTMYANYELDGNFTLGGTMETIGNAKVISTSDSLTDTNLTFSGNLGLSNVMLIEGDSTQVTTPKFNGLLSVENATVQLTGSPTEINRLTIPNTVKLRSIGSIIDELDLVTGVFTKRIECIKLIGSENWQLGSHQSTNYQSFKIDCADLKQVSLLDNMTCDRFKPLAWTTLTDKAFEFITGNGTIEINICKENLTTPDVEGFKRWLNEHPTTVIYELKEPSTTTLSIRWASTPVSSFDGTTTIESSVSQSLKPYLYALIATTTLEQLVSVLKEKNADLEEESLSTMMAITEVFEMVMIMMPVSTSIINSVEDSTQSQPPLLKGGFQMVEVYVTLILKGKKTLEDVPTVLRPKVESMLKELGALE